MKYYDIQLMQVLNDIKPLMPGDNKKVTHT